MKRKILAGWLSVVLAVGLLPTPAVAVEGAPAESASVCSEIASGDDVEKSNAVASSVARSVARASLSPNKEHGTGDIGSYEPAQSIHDANYQGRARAAALPSSYSSVDQGNVTPVVDQGSFGTCWAFSAIAAAESSILSQGLADQVDLSERHLAYFTYHKAADELGGITGDLSSAKGAQFSPEFGESKDPYLASGGNNYFTMFTLASWMGATNESHAPYSELQSKYDALQDSLDYESGDYVNKINSFLSSTALSDEDAFNSSYHLENAQVIAMEDRDEVKQAIVDHGAVGVSYNSDGNFLNGETSSYFNPVAEDTDHAVALVGWDDNYDRTKFGGEDILKEAEASPVNVVLGKPVDLQLNEEGAVWLRFTPEASGFYDIEFDYVGENVSAGEDDASMWTYTAVYRKAIENEHFYCESDGYFYCKSDRQFYGEKDTTYYVCIDDVTDDEGSLTSVRATICETDESEEREVPSQVSRVQVDRPISLSDSVTEGKWLAFTPSKSGRYTFTFSTEGTVDAYIYCLNNYRNSLNERAYCGVYIGDPDSKSYVLKAGATYYFHVYLGSEFGDTNTLTVSFDAPVESASADIASYNEDVTPVRPAKNGAWLLKNSWGTDSGDEGYYWISYEDATLNAEWSNVFAYEMAPADNYDHNYQYDGTSGACYNVLPSGGSIANRYEVKGNPSGGEALRAVGLALADVNVSYSIQVYLNPENAADPLSGIPALSAPVKGTTSHVGYYTVDLGCDIALDEGDTFAVVATLSHADGSPVNYYVDATYELDFCSHANACQAGQSLSLYPGASRWYDLAGAAQDELDEPRSTARLKAFTNDVSAAERGKISLSGAEVVLDGIKDESGQKRATVKVSLGGAPLTYGAQYVAQQNYNAQTREISVTILGRGAYTGTKTVTFTVPRTSIASAVVSSIPEQAYTGKPITPQPTVTAGGKTLKNGNDYELSYENNVNVGTATVIVTGKGDYEGTKRATFQIKKSASSGGISGSGNSSTVKPQPKPVSLATATVAAPSLVYSGKALKPKVAVKVGGKTLRLGTDYTVSYASNKTPGLGRVTVTGRGAYTGTKTATFKILPKGTSVKKLAKARRGFTVKWKKQAKQVDGYRVQWSTDKKFKKGVKSKTVKLKSSAGKKCALKVSGLKGGKKYYVRVCTYKAVKANGKTAKYYSPWSKAKSVTTKK